MLAPSRLAFRSLFLLSVLALAPVTARAANELVDEDTHTTFNSHMEVAGTKYECLGAGVRKVFWFVRVYALTFCVDPVTVKGISDAAKAKGENADKLADDTSFFDGIVKTPGGKLVILHLTHDISQEQMAKAFRESLSKVLAPEKVEKLIAAIPGSAHTGEIVQLYSSGNSLTIDIAGKAKKIDDEDIARNLWYVYLGKDGVSPPLKKSIAMRALAGF
jgi:hypothetical protein